MAENSDIEWTDHTFNPWLGCTAVSPACDNCYAEAFSKRVGGPAWGAGEPRRRTKNRTWQQALKWNARAAQSGERERVFCASFADVFDTEVPAEWRDDALALVAATPYLDWLLLTKRAKAMRDSLSDPNLQDRVREGLRRIFGDGGLKYDRFAATDSAHVAFPLPNVWAMVSAENQKMLDARVPYLMQTPARVRGLSMEPLLEDVNVAGAINDCGCGECDYCLEIAPTPTKGVDWIIVGGESGPRARATDPEWVRNIRDECVGSRVAFLFKQWGAWAPFLSRDGSTPGPRTHIWREDVREPCDVRRTPVAEGSVWRRSPKEAGRLLDGMEWNQAPLPRVRKLEPVGASP